MDRSTQGRYPAVPHGREALREGLARFMRSSEAPPFPDFVAHVFTRAHVRQRVRLLKCLLQSVGPLALAAVAAGAFVKCVARAGWARVAVTAEDAVTVSYGQVLELARYVEQANPRVVDQLATLIARDPATLAIVGSSLIALSMLVRNPGRVDSASKRAADRAPD
jgi:hypothetical protein